MAYKMLTAWDLDATEAAETLSVRCMERDSAIIKPICSEGAYASRSGS